MEHKRARGHTRRAFLSSTAVAIILGSVQMASALIIGGERPGTPFDASPPDVLSGAAPGRWFFFTDEEAETIGAITEQLIPADELSISGKEAGCTEYIDRQLAGFFGNFDRLYMRGPFESGTPEQGDQSSLVPRARYRLGIAALNGYCSATFKQPFAKLTSEQRDQVLTDLQHGKIAMQDIDSMAFFSLVHANTMEGFFADPIYGGNKDMVSWKMLGFPGAHYDYRNYVERHNQTLDLPPVGIAGRPEWNIGKDR